jgi:hypothetical protein
MTGATSGAGRAGPRYEARDADVHRLLQYGLILCLVITLALLGVAKLLTYLTTRQPHGRTGSPLTVATDLPPKPRLQIAPRLDLAQKRKAEDEALNSYAWIDRSAGTVRIPIDRAIDLLAERAATQDVATSGSQSRAPARPTRHAKER